MDGSGKRLAFLISGLILFLVLAGCTKTEPYFTVYQWYEGDDLGDCAGPVKVHEAEGKWIVLDIYAAQPMPATDGVRGWQYHILGSDGEEYSWFSTSWGCVKDFYSTPTTSSASELGTKGNIIFVLPKGVEPEKLVLKTEEKQVMDWTFDENLRKQEPWFASTGGPIDTTVVGPGEEGQTDSTSTQECGGCSSEVMDCDQVNESASKAFCYQGLAYSQGNSSVCELIDDEMGTIKDYCYVAIAGIKGNDSICTGIKNTTNADKCYLSSAQTSANLASCGYIVEQETKDWCYQEVAEKTLDPSICAGIESQAYKDSCYWGLAVKKPDSSLCAMARAEDDPDMESCYTNVAEESDNVSICDLIPGASGKADCRKRTYAQHFLMLNEKDISVCENIPGDVPENLHGLYADECYLTFAQGFGNTTMCEQIESPGLKDDCYYGFAVYGSRSEMCGLIENPAKQGDCYRISASKQKNDAVCELIESQDYKDLCYGELAGMQLDATLTDHIEDPTYKDFKIHVIAGNKGEVALCDGIQNTVEKENCRNYTGTTEGNYSFMLRLWPVNESYCDSRPSYLDEDECFNILVRYESDASVCEKIGNQYVKDTCFGRLAVDSKNVTLCKGLASQIERDNCYGSLALDLLDPTLIENIGDEQYKDGINRMFGELVQ